MRTLSEKLSSIEDDPKLKGVLKLMIESIDEKDHDGFFELFDVLLKMMKQAMLETEPK